MKLKQLLEELNQLAKERPDTLEMEIQFADTLGNKEISLVREIKIDFCISEPFIVIE